MASKSKAGTSSGESSKSVGKGKVLVGATRTGKDERKVGKGKVGDGGRCGINDKKESLNEQKVPAGTMARSSEKARGKGGPGKEDAEKKNKDEKKKKENKTTEKHTEGIKVDKVGGRKAGGGGGVVQKKLNEERKGKNGSLPSNKGSTKGNGFKPSVSTGGKESLNVGDYLTLLKLLNIKLPKGVLNPEVIKHSRNRQVMQDAKAIVEDLERFKLQFVVVPRLGCGEVKRALDLKKSSKVQDITRMIFFKNTKDLEKTLMAIWKENVLNTGHGFRMTDTYMAKPISTPSMYNTVETRSWRVLEAGQERAEVTQGTRVTTSALEKMEFSDESYFTQEVGDQKKKKSLVNEMECLKFFHELKEMDLVNKDVRYTRGNKVDFGFLTGNVDFLAVITPKQGSAKHRSSNSSQTEKIIIECKGTDGDMVGKVFTKPTTGHRAHFTDSHEYCYQTQAYTYILKRTLQSPARVRAVMVVRHYHSDSSTQRGFYWNYLKDDHEKQIEELRVFCQKEVLARFLAVLNIIFQKEKVKEA